MKEQYKFFSILLAAAILLTSAGCGSLFESEYYYSEPYSDNISRPSGDSTEISNYSMLKSALTGLINRHEEQSEFRFSNYNGSVSDDLAAACFEVKNSNPLGAFAVNTLNYDTSRIVSYYVAEIYITYKKTAEEISSIVSVTGTTELGSLLCETLAAFDETAVVRSYSTAINPEYIETLVEGFYLSDPVSLVLPPSVNIEAYLGAGTSCIYDIGLSYDLDVSVLQTMSGTLTEAIAALTGTFAETEPAKLALECAESLSGLLSAAPDSDANGSTAYGALVEHAADSKGIALAYKALCSAMGLECMVVKGSIGTMGTEEHYWNIIALDDDFYHVDVSQFAFDPAYAFLLDDDSLWGTYIWDTEDYPACRGALRYGDLVPPAEEPEATAPQPGTETPPPAASDPVEETPQPSPPPAAPETEGEEIIS